LLGDCSTDEIPTNDKDGFGDDEDRPSDIFDEFDDVSILDI